MPATFENMAITILKEPSGIYPAYNDSFIEFTSSLAGNNRAEVTASPASLFPNVFTLFPSPEGKYLFNLKEVVKTVLNQGGFNDANFFSNAYFKSISGLYLLQSITVEVFSEGSSETFSKNYEFFKSVKQIDEVIFSNPFQLLNKSRNGVDFYLTYFEGFPFHFDIQRVIASAGKEITIKNKNTGLVSAAMNPDFTGAFRFNVDRSNSENWTSGGFLPLTNGLNNLEIYEDGEFRTNVFLKKKKPCSGIYLKWFNSEGGFSHWLFNEYGVEKVKGKDLDLIHSNTFANVGSFDSGFKSIGKEASRTLRVKTRCDQNETRELKSLFYSPLIQLYTSRTPNEAGVFIDVRVEEVFELKEKNGNQEFILNLELPQLITARL